MTEPDHPLRRNLDLLRAELEESVAEAKAGQTVPMEDVLRSLNEAQARIRSGRAAMPAAE